MSEIPKIKFVIDTNSIKIMGRDLYSSDNAIIVEMIANSYDADATEVKITFDKNYEKITIEDNGSGMDLDEIAKNFLHVGYVEKKYKKSVYERKKLGSKGIGKLSIFALGEIAKITTQKNNVCHSFILNYKNLINNKNDIEIKKENNNQTGTKIIISNLLKFIKNKKNFFVNNLVIGIWKVFSEILFDKKFNFKIKIRDLNHQNQNWRTLEAKEKDFKKTLIFFSLDSETDKKIQKIKEGSKEHLEEMKQQIKNIGYEDLCCYENSFESWQRIEEHKNYKNIGYKKQEWKNSLKGYIAAIVTSKNIRSSEKDGDEKSKNQWDDTADWNSEEKNKIIIKESNRRISVYSHSRAGDLNVKGSLNLAAKFYQKYLFGKIHADFLIDKNSEDDEIAMPNRESYKKHDDRWIYLKTCLKILGNYAMDFSNKIPKKNLESSNNESRKIFNKYYKKATTTKEKRNIKNFYLEERKLNILWKKNQHFILLSFKSKDKTKENNDENNWSQETAFKMKLIIEECIEKIDKKNEIKILFTDKNNQNEKYDIPEDKRFFVYLKEQLPRGREYFFKTHVFAFVTKNYTNNFWTDVEYGMGIAFTRMGEDKLWRDLSVFVKEDKRDQHTKYIEQDQLKDWNIKEVVKKVKKFLQDFFGKDKKVQNFIKTENIRKIVEKNIDKT